MMIQWMESLFTEVLGKSLDAAVVVLCILCVRGIVGRYARKYAYLLWSVLAVRLLWFWPVTNYFSFFRLPVFKSDLWQNTRQLPERLKEYGSLGNSDALLSGTQMQAEVLHPEAVSLTLAQKVLLGGTVLWLAGILLFLVYFCVSYLRMKRRVRFAVRIEDGIWQGNCVPSPFVMGIFRPQIYLPSGLDERQMRHVVCHEKQHIRRKDYLVKLLAFFLLAVYWFHPLIWLSYFLMCRDMEMSCDEAVLKELGMEEKKAYSATLLAFASGKTVPGNLLGFEENSAKSRIRHVLRYQKPGTVLAEILSLVCVLSLTIWGFNHQSEADAGQENAGGSGSQILADSEEGGTVSEQAQQLYEAGTPYLGDASAVGNLLSLLGQQGYLPELDYTLELQTSERPYVLQMNFSDGEGDTEEVLAYMGQSGTLMLALVENLDEIRWGFSYGEEENSVIYYWDAEASRAMFPSLEDVKSYGKSPEAVEELLGILAQENMGEQQETISTVGGADGPTSVYIS